ncbi:MAG: 1-phosphofructokinase [Caldilineae bacterium]|nr:MAG: 1-phosphofructokinase [Caldilineae bacterium]
MIYTLTLNPAVDRELQVTGIRYNRVLRAEKWRVDVGGKGFNVSRMLKALGEDSMALAFAGGHAGRFLQEGLQELGVATEFAWIPGETRSNVSIVDRQQQRYIKVNEPGPTVPPEAQEAMLTKIRSLARRGDWWVLSGSLPPGVPAHYYATVIRALNDVGAHTVLDTSGPALHVGCQAAPYVVKPNRAELGELTGLPTQTPEQWVAAARRVLALGAHYVAVSLGEEGALLATNDEVWLARPPRIHERNPIGAGDSMVGGLVWALRQGLPPQEILAAGVACGAATAALDGTAVGSLAAVQELLPQVVCIRMNHDSSTR